MKTHIKLPRNESRRRAIVCGSPERAAWFASKLEGFELLSQNREYHSYCVNYKDTDVLIVSHGVGAAGAAICFQELIDAGETSIIRIGTAGGFYDDAKIGDVVIPTGCVRKDGVSNLMIPPEFPAIPDWELTNKLRSSYIEKASPPNTGIILTSDMFYPGLLPNQFDMYKTAGALAVEMECSALFVTALVRKIQASAILVLDGMPLVQSGESYDPSPERLAAPLEACFWSALETLVKLPVS